MKKCILILVILSLNTISAETIILKEGNSLRGRVIGQDIKTLRVRLPDGKVSEIPKRNILKVLYREVSPAEEKKIKDTEKKKQEDLLVVQAEEIHDKNGTIVYGHVRQHLGSEILIEINNIETRVPVKSIQRIVFNKSIQKGVLTRQLEAEKEKERLARLAEEEELKKKIEKEKLIQEAIELKTSHERISHNVMVEERRRLPYTEGVLEYSGGQKIYTELIDETEAKYVVVTDYGIMQLNDLDFGKTMKITNDLGKQEIPRDRILTLKNTKPENGKIYLNGGQVFPGKVLTVSGSTAIIQSGHGKLAIPVSHIAFPSVQPAENTKPGIHVKNGEYARFHINDEQQINGKIVFRSDHSVIFDTAYGMIEVHPDYIVSAVSAPLPRKKRNR